MSKSTDTKHCHIMEGKLALPYTYFAGRTGSKFLISIRDHHKIMGVRCDNCSRVFVPPRQICEKCMEDISDKWVELSDSGVVENFTIVRYTDRHLPLKTPYVLALIRLDGADTPMAHIVSGIAPEEVNIGMRVKAVFSDRISNTILDIDHFAPMDQG